MSRIELTIMTDVYKYNEEDETEILVKRNAKSKIYVNREDIGAIGQMINENGNIRIHTCKIAIRDIGNMIVKLPYSKAKQLVEDNTKHIGYGR